MRKKHSALQASAELGGSTFHIGIVICLLSDIEESLIEWGLEHPSNKALM